MEQHACGRRVEHSWCRLWTRVQTTTPAELLQWGGAVFLDGMLGGTHGAILKQFYKSTKLHDVDIASAFVSHNGLRQSRCASFATILRQRKREVHCTTQHATAITFAVWLSTTSTIWPSLPVHACVLMKRLLHLMDGERLTMAYWRLLLGSLVSQEEVTLSSSLT